MQAMAAYLQRLTPRRQFKQSELPRKPLHLDAEPSGHEWRSGCFRWQSHLGCMGCWRHIAEGPKAGCTLCCESCGSALRHLCGAEAFLGLPGLTPFVTPAKFFQPFIERRRLCSTTLGSL